MEILSISFVLVSYGGILNCVSFHFVETRFYLGKFQTMHEAWADLDPSASTSRSQVLTEITDTSLHT